MKNILSSKICAAALVLTASAATMTFNAQNADAGERRVEIGTLRCDVRSGNNFIFGSTKHLDCELAGRSGKTLGTYRGKIKRFGIDIGESRKTVMAWVVLAPTRGFRASSLNGNYVGVAADVALGIGGGAKVLVGGSRDTITLQPLSLQAQRGVNLALTVAEMTLHAD